MLDMDWLIHPYEKREFLGKVWQRKPLILSSDRAGYLDSLFSDEAMERALEFGQPKPPSIRLASSASNEKVQVPFCPNGRLDIDKLRKHYFRGQTIILNTVEDYDPAVARLARSIETELGARIQVNAYLTPPGAQGFRPHYDTHDVLVAQIRGEKLWKLHGEDAACPLNEMVDGNPKLPETVDAPDEIRLRAGDVLYIPRGWIHEAATVESASLHLTFGIHAPLGRDLLASALESLSARHPELRAALPPGPLARNREKVEAIFADLVELFAANADAGAAANAIDDQLLRRGRSGGDGHMFRDMNSLGRISSETIIQRRTDLPCRLVASEEGVGLQFLNGLVTGPAHFESAMRFVIERETPFCVADLPELEPDHQLGLGSSLVMDGLCRLSESRWQM